MITNFLKIIASALAAVLVCSCGTSPFSGVQDGSAQLASSRSPEESHPAQQHAETGAAREPGPAEPRQDDILKKVAQYTSAGDPASKAYRIGPGDALDITVFKVPDLSKTVQVSSTGTINYPLVGEVIAAGRTAREVEQDLTRKLGAKYLQNPSVTVFVKEYNSQRITVEGNVAKPGVISMAGGMSLLQAIAQAGGLGNTADSTVMLFRSVDGRRRAAKFDLSDIRSGNAEDPSLQSGDVIIVPTSDMRASMEWATKFVPLAGIAPLL